MITNETRTSSITSRLRHRHTGVALAVTVMSAGCVGSRDADSTFDPLPDLSATVDAAGLPDSSVTLPPEDTQAVLTDGSSSSDAGLRINEVAASGDPEDWVELINLSTGTISLDGYALADAADGTPVSLPSGLSIESGGLLVIEVTELTFGFKIGSDEALYLFDPTGAPIDAADWDEGASPDGGSYARIPNGTGDFETTVPATRGEPNGGAIEPTPDVIDIADEGDVAELDSSEDKDVTTPDVSTTDVATPDVSTVPDSQSGTDTGPGPDDLPAVVINEVTSTGTDEIEVLNVGSSTVDLSGWAIVDEEYVLDPTTPDHRYDFPSGSSLGPGKYLVLEGDVDHPFGVGKSDRLQLLAPSDVVVDETSWTEPAAATSWCRIPNGTGDFQLCDVATFGVSNGGPPLPGVLALNEITSSGDDIIELVNLGPGPAVAAGHAVSDDGYDPAVPETVPLHYSVLASPTVLAPGERVVLVKGTDHVFGLGKSDSVTLWSPDGVALDTTSWVEPDAEVSWCRSPDATGPFGACSVATPGTANP